LHAAPSDPHVCLIQGADLLTLPRFVRVDHHYLKVVHPPTLESLEIPHEPPHPGQPFIEHVDEVMADQQEGIEHVAGVVGQPFIPPTPGVVHVPYKAPQPERSELVRTKKDYFVKSGDIYIAYKAFCRDCRKVAHTTEKCPERPARQAPARARGGPLPPVWGSTPPPPFPDMFSTGMLPPGLIPSYMPPGFPGVPGYPPFPPMHPAASTVPPVTPGKRPRGDPDGA
jgi:hypothetical protein